MGGRFLIYFSPFFHTLISSLSANLPPFPLRRYHHFQTVIFPAIPSRHIIWIHSFSLSFLVSDYPCFLLAPLSQRIYTNMTSLPTQSPNAFHRGHLMNANISIPDGHWFEGGRTATSRLGGIRAQTMHLMNPPLVCMQ